MELIKNNMEQKGAAEEQHHNRKQLIVFKIGNEEYGITIDQIKEVVITPNITKLPRAKGYVKGVANIRGNVISIIDLEEKFGVDTSEGKSATANNYTMVVESDEFKVGVLSREVPNTLLVPENQIMDASNIIQDTNLNSNYIRGIARSGDKLIILIDIKKVVSDEDITVSHK